MPLLNFFVFFFFFFFFGGGGMMPEVASPSVWGSDVETRPVLRIWCALGFSGASPPVLRPIV